MVVGAKRSSRAKARDVATPRDAKSGDVAAPGLAPAGLSHAFVEAVTKDFIAHGAEAIVKMRTEKPDLYLKIVLGILPKELTDAASGGTEFVVIERRIVHDPD